MTRHERESRINKILSRLDQICHEDRALIQNRSSKPVTISVEHLFEEANGPVFVITEIKE
jgi:hypothetical protein